MLLNEYGVPTVYELLTFPRNAWFLIWASVLMTLPPQHFHCPHLCKNLPYKENLKVSVSLFTMLTFLVLLAFLAGGANALNFPVAPQQLYCNRINGNFYGQSVMFGQVMQDGDQLTINGSILPIKVSVQFSLWGTAGLNQVPFHFRQDVPQQRTIYNNYVGRWANEIFGPSIFQSGQNYQVTVKMVGNTFQLWSNGGLYYTFTARSSTVGIQALDVITYEPPGGQSTNWIEMECVNPPWPRTTTRRPGGRPPGGRPVPGHGHGGHGHGGHGHEGHGHGGGSYDSSDDSSSSESCEN